MSNTGGFVHRTKGTPLCVHCKTDRARGYLELKQEFSGHLTCNSCGRTFDDAIAQGPMPAPPEEPKEPKEPKARKPRKKKAKAVETDEAGDSIDPVLDTDEPVMPEVFTPDVPKQKKGLFGGIRGNS